MKNLAKRGLSMLLALAMCLSLLAGMTFTASAASYTYNWGQRGTVADELSDAAVAWYSKYNVEYSELAQLSGSSSTSSVPSSALYTELKDIMTTAHSYKNSYDANKTLCAYTDCQNGGGVISSFYSGKSIGPDWDGTWNREHTWPNSKGLGGSDENDIMMIRPTSTSENSSRGNTAYGEGSSYYDPNDESGGTYNLHGDVARIVLYVYTRWGNTSYMWGTSGVMESKDVLLKWMEEDPVDTWELGRNDAVQSITGTRNMFVDYPELAFLLFNEEVPAGYISPSGEGSAASYSITAYSNNSTYGTVSLSGKTITATPKTGYYVSGYTVTSGTATVTQSGNTFKVSASSDCSIMINFAAKTAVTLTFMENGTVGSTVASYGGDTVTLPSNTNTPADGYTFVGWTDTTVTDTTEKPTLYTAGSSFTAADKTFYAVYTYSVGGTGVTDYVLTDIANIQADDVFVITSATSSTVYALPNDTVSKGPEAVTVTVSGDKLASEPASNLLWNLGGTTDAWEFYPDGDTSRWLASSNDNNGMSVGTGTNKTYKINSGYLYNIGVSRYVGVYTSNPDWRCYTSSSGNIANQTLGFYVKTESGTLYYSTSTVVCEHANTTDVAEVPATCSQTGYTAGVYCNDCETYISGHEVTPMTDHEDLSEIAAVAPSCTETGLTDGIFCNDCQQVVVEQEVVAATGHSYEGVVTAPTETEQGYTTYTCTACGDSYVSDYTEALGETFYVSFSVPADVTDIATMTCNKDGITLPTADAPEGYSFLGWTTAAVEDTETKPEILTGTYNAVENITLYALYSYVEGGTGVSNYVKVTSAPADWSGEYVIVYESGSVIFDSSLTSLDANNNNQSVTITDSTIAADEADAYKVTIEAVTGGYSIQTASGYYIGATGNSNSLNSNKTTVYTNTLSMNSDGSVNVIGSGGAYLRYNTSASRFRYYKSSTYAGQKAVALYVKTESGTTYYTTLTTVAPVAAVGGVEYTTFEEAYAASSDGQYIQLLDNIYLDSLEMTKDLYIDLNGKTMEAVVDSGEYAVYGIDTATDQYDASSGWLCLLDQDSSIVAPQIHVQTDSKRYMAIENDSGWSFHRYYVGITTIVLSTHTTGIGYKAQFWGTDEVVAQLADTQAFSYTLRLEGGGTITRSLDTVTSGQVVSLRVNNFDVANYSETALYAKVSITLGDTVIESAEHSITMKQLVETVNENYTNYPAQLDALAAFVEKYYDTMSSWQVENLYKPE